jgi:hypothetical protein
LTGGDLIATAAVLGSAAFAAGGAAVSALAGTGAAAAGTGSAASAGGAGSNTRTAVAGVGSFGGVSAGGSSLSPPSSPASVFGAARTQPDPPLRSSAPLMSPGLPSIGGEPLEGSGFEGQRSQQGFAPMSVAATADPMSGPDSSRPSAVHGGMSGIGSEGTAAPNLSTAASSGGATDVASVGNADLANPQSASLAGRKSMVGRAVDQVMRGMRFRLLRLPSDAAPYNTPPRIPIDHEE